MSVLKYKKLHPDARIEPPAYSGDAGYDLRCTEGVTLVPHGRAQIKTGIAVEFPEGYFGCVWDKSGLSHTSGIKVMGGVIDSGYRGEILVGVVNTGNDTFTFQKGDKVAQLILQKREYADLKEVDTLSPSEREDLGFGSSGK